MALDPSSPQGLYRLYRVLLQKYADVINQKEMRTIGEVKALVAKDDLTIQSLIERFKPENFSFESDYLQACQSAYSFVCDEIDFVKADVRLSYWLSPKEILENKVADDEDRAVFLCSLLAALGDEKAEVVIAELDDLSTHAFVITEFSGRFFLLDTCQTAGFFDFAGNREDVLGRYSFNGYKLKRFLYKFNRTKYEQFI